MRLRDLIGQDQARGVLLRAVGGGRVASAYVFEGPAGVGKRSAALGLGLAMACPVEHGIGCGTCDVCRRIEAGIHPDVPTFSPPESQILIEQARAIVALSSGRPHEAPARVIVVDDADRMTPQAANCLLKTLEEPAPANHIVLVTAAPERLLPTIRSRAQRVRFGPLPAETVVTLLAGRGVERPRAETAAALADGSPARALAIAGAGDPDASWRAAADLRRAAGLAAGATLSAISRAAAPYGDKETRQSLPAILALLGRFYRDAMVTASGAPELTLLRDAAAEIGAAARRGLPALDRALAAVVEAEQALAANLNAPLSLERLMLEMRDAERRDPP